LSCYSGHFYVSELPLRQRQFTLPEKLTHRLAFPLAVPGIRP